MNQSVREAECNFTGAKRAGDALKAEFGGIAKSIVIAHLD